MSLDTYLGGWNRSVGNEFFKEDVVGVWLKEVLPDYVSPRRILTIERKFPTIVCLCGSTRFVKQFQEAEFDETLKGNIVLTIGCDTKSDAELFTGEQGKAIKQQLDELHKRKIDLCDEILVLNVDGYIGESTRSEIEYAESYNKRIRYLETTPVGWERIGSHESPIYNSREK